jgi:hypothetical protein
MLARLLWIIGTLVRYLSVTYDEKTREMVVTITFGFGLHGDVRIPLGHLIDLITSKVPAGHVADATTAEQKIALQRIAGLGIPARA